MKITRSILCFLLLFSALSCSKNEEVKPDPIIEPKPEPEPAKNKAPSTPKLKQPQDALQCAYTTLTFEWEPAIDPEKEAMVYEFQIFNDAALKNLVYLEVMQGTSVDLELQSGNAYYWRVKARDTRGLESEYSQLRQLSTEPVLNFNSIPYPAEVETPGNFASIAPEDIVLKWNSEDRDGDVLKFDLYLGTTDPPELYLNDLEVNSHQLSLEKGQTYYWKVNVKDGKGTKAIGETWIFKTL